MHLVHRNSKYPDLKSATGEMDGIAVFAALLEVEPYGDEYDRDWVRGFRSHPHIPEVDTKSSFLKVVMIFSFF